ncbi:helix-turn-helix domain-containing protein [Pseudoflavonifractor phocaeensis]|uniref:helix-turn-helix domain-containing protein n=1 Tax=Pseudoflavonifractor phocaeensis TaxID=1870988 RepID=UPI00195619BC|nr:helix-turn-helix domain-containing protein [Pseudoflavonifractor phocaeensis]MBM6870791.1 helix-turn-helix domain-containing protein [Pseudoflavonifractor phocaeensis]
MKANEKQEGRPSYWALIPATVRYDAHLPPNAKLLFGEVTALSNKMGYCRAGNGYFASLFGLSDRSVRRLIALLAERGYLCVEVIRDEETQEVTERRIFPLYGERGAVCPPPDKIVPTPPDKDVLTPPDKNVLYNNTSIKYNIPPTPQGEERKKETLSPEIKAMLADYAGEDQALAQALDGLMEIRTAKKAVNSETAVRQLLKRLDQFSGGDRKRKLALLEEATTNSWKTVYLPRGETPPGRRETRHVE